MNKEKRYLTIAIPSIIVVLIFPAMSLQYRHLKRVRADVINYQNKIDEHNRALLERPVVSEDKGKTINNINSINERYFIPFMQEDILLRISEIMVLTNINIATINFSEPQEVDFTDKRQQNTEAQISFGRALANAKSGNINPTDESEILLNDVKKYFYEALRLMEDNPLYKPNFGPVDIEYRTERTELNVSFSTNELGNIIQLFNSLKAHSKHIPIESFTVSKGQDGWTGSITFHLYMFPDYP